MTKVVLLCGGKGTRLGEVTEGRIPKPMVKIGGKPILWHLMDSYAKYGFNDFIICAGHLGQNIKEYFLNFLNNSSDIQIDMQNGTFRRLSDVTANWTVTIADTGDDTMTAGRILRIVKYLDDDDQVIMLTYGDGLSDIDFRALLAFHKAHGKLATITGVTPPGRFGELSLSNEQVIQMSEKPDVTDRYINGGFMVLDRKFISRYCDVSNADEIMLERAPLETAAVDGELMVYRHSGFWQCMDTARDWEVLDNLARQSKVPWI